MSDITTVYLQSEIDYRAERVRSGVAGSRRTRRGRVRRPRLPAEAVERNA